MEGVGLQQIEGLEVLLTQAEGLLQPARCTAIVGLGEAEPVAYQPGQMLPED